jgi:hypothetical protein
MRRPLLAVAAVCALTGPTALAFFSGGFYAESRLPAALVTWALVLGLCAVGPAPFPRGGPGRMAVAGLALLTAWSAASIAWAPLGGPAVESVQRLLLYLGAFLLAIGVLRSPWASRATEVVLAAGVTVVIGYGLAGLLLPGILEFDRSKSAGGRLEQPITYWNAEGALAAVGLVLCTRLAGDPSRPTWLRGLAGASAVPLAAGIYLTFSRGAAAVAVAGLVLLVAFAPTRPQARAAATSLILGVLAAGALSMFDGVSAAQGTLDERMSDGAYAGTVLIVLAIVAAALTVHAGRRQRRHPPTPIPPHRARAGALAVTAVLLAAAGVLIVGALGERPSQAELAAGADAERLTTVTSNRYEYWRVALDAFAREPIIGLGAAGFRVEWRREREITESVQDVHSIVVEVASELGSVGLLAFAILIGGIAAAARRALAADRQAAAGACAATLAWLLHASIDWDWQFPAVTLPAIALAGLLVVLGEPTAVSAGGGPQADRVGAARPAPYEPSRDRSRPRVDRAAPKP